MDMHEFSKRFIRKPKKPKTNTPERPMSIGERRGIEETLKHHSHVRGMNVTGSRKATTGGIGQGGITVDRDALRKKEEGLSEFHGYGKAFQGGDKERKVSLDEEREYHRSGYLPPRLVAFLPQGSQGRTNYRTKREKWKTEQGITRGRWETMSPPGSKPSPHKARSRPEQRSKIIPHSEFGDHEFRVLPKGDLRGKGLPLDKLEQRQAKALTPNRPPHTWRTGRGRPYQKGPGGTYSRNPDVDMHPRQEQLMRKGGMPRYIQDRDVNEGYTSPYGTTHTSRHGYAGSGERGKQQYRGPGKLHEFDTGDITDYSPARGKPRKGGWARYYQDLDQAEGRQGSISTEGTSGRTARREIRGPGFRGRQQRVKEQKKYGFGETMRNFGDDQFLLFFANEHPEAFQAVAGEFQEFSKRSTYERWKPKDHEEPTHSLPPRVSGGRAGSRGPYDAKHGTMSPDQREELRRAGRRQRRGDQANEFSSEPDYRWGRPRGKGHPEDKPGDQPIKSLPPKHRGDRGGSRGSHEVIRGDRGGSRGPHDVKHGTLSAEQRRYIAEAGEKNRASIEERKRRGTYSSEFNDFSLQEFKNKRKVAMGKQMLRFMEQFQMKIHNQGELELINRMKATGNEKDIPKSVLEKFSVN